MTGISPSVFLARDVLEHVLPSLLAVVLFLPFCGVSASEIAEQNVLLAAIVGAYVAGSLFQAVNASALVSRPMAWLFSILSNSRDVGQGQKSNMYWSGESVQSVRDRTEWIGRNWDMDSLFSLLSKEEREYFYLTRAYLRLFQLSSMLAFGYFLLNSLWLVGVAILSHLVLETGPAYLFEIESPLIGGIAAPTLLLCLLSLVGFASLYNWYRVEYGSLFAEWGLHSQMARRYQRKEGGVASAIWGRVRKEQVDGSEVAEDRVSLRVELFRKSKMIGASEPDPDGHFQFPAAFKSCVGNVCRLVVFSDTRRVAEFQLNLQEKDVPEFEVELEAAFNPVAGEDG